MEGSDFTASTRFRTMVGLLRAPQNRATISREYRACLERYFVISLTEPKLRAQPKPPLNSNPTGLRFRV